MLFFISNTHKHHICFKRDLAVNKVPSTKVNRYFYEMAKIGVMIIQNIYIFSICKILFQNVIQFSLIIYQNKLKFQEKIENTWFIIRNGTLYQL